nr:Na/Pi cotransporter family protein [Eubacterium sp.]
MIEVLELFGGVGLFLFGMSLMGSSLEKLAGSGLTKILATLTTSKKKGVGAIKGWTLGLGVTGIIQSSAATTIMLIGFVNAGIMVLSQAIPVVFGANIGSCVTAQILRLGDLGGGTIVLQLLKPSSFAPLLVAVGSYIYIFIKKQKLKDVAGILIGLGTLFYGMTMMEEVFAPLKESEKFQQFFTSFQNPLIGILTGLVLTAIIQSSSASVGILQALSATGSVTYATAVPIIIGQNIGKCMTIILGGIGANKKAKRVALSYLLFNIFGAVLFSAVIYGLYYTVGIPGFDKVVNRGNIANIHLLFNLITSLILLPFSNQIAKLTGTILKDSDEKPGDEELSHLDPMLLSTPGIALQQCIKVITSMGEKILDNFNYASELINEYKPAVFTNMQENESFIDKCETVLSDYIVKIDRKRLTNDNKFVVTEILNSIGDFERIGDYCMNMAYVAERKSESGLVFSDVGQMELATITEATRKAVETVLKAFIEENGGIAARVEPLADTIDELKEIIKSHHVERLQEGDCGVQGGVALFDLINCYERIAAHASNIALHVVKRTSGDKEFDEMHGHVTDTETEEYIALEKYYEQQYIDPVKKYTKKKAAEKK